MEAISIVEEIESLPPEAQKQVFDFVAFLKTRYQKSPAARRRRRGKPSEEPFVGMWADREDMADSSTWVRDLRRREWECKR